MSVIGIHIVKEGGDAPVSLEAVRAVAGKGLEGDHHFERPGNTYKGKPSTTEVTLIEAEALDAAARDYGLAVDHAETRRNILVRGVALNHLVERNHDPQMQGKLASKALCPSKGAQMQGILASTIQAREGP